MTASVVDLTATENRSTEMSEPQLSEVSDPNAKAVLKALANPKWLLRTPSGISRETHVPEDDVRAILEKYQNFVRVSGLPDPSGRTLYTLRQRPVSQAEKWAILRVFLTKSL